MTLYMHMNEVNPTIIQHGWLVALTIVIGAVVTAAGVGLQIWEFVKRKGRGS